MLIFFQNFDYAAPIVTFKRSENSENNLLKLFFKYFFGVPHLSTCIFLFFYNEPELGVEIHPGMALTLKPCKTGKFSLRPYQNDYRN